MIRSRRVRALALVGVSCLACRSQPRIVAAPPGAPDIVLVSIDSLRADHLGAYGYGPPTSPTIDRIAAEGVLFRQAVSTTSWTLPAHAAMFTGLYDSAHELFENGLRLRDSRLTLAELLRDHGWQTAGFFGGPYLHPTFGLAQGFETYRSCMTAVADAAPDARVRADARAVESPSHGDVTGPRTVEEIDRWIGTADARPMFLFVHLWDVHYDYIPPPEYAARFDPGYEGPIDGRGVLSSDQVRADMPARDLRHLEALYDGEIRFTDDNLARILSSVARRGRMRDTILVVTADHGEEFFEHGGKGHQRTLFDEVVRVPLIVRWPGHLAHREIGQQVRLVDLLPTLAALAGIDPPVHLSGRDLSPLLRGDALPDAPALLELLVDRHGLQAIRTGSFKLVSRGNGRPRVGFDLTTDPGERRPLGIEDARVIAGLQQLEAELRAARKLRLDAGGVEPIDADPELLRRLRNLGYLDR